MKELQHDDFLKLVEVHNLLEVGTDYSELEKITQKSTGGVILAGEIRPRKFMNEIFSKSLPSDFGNEALYTLADMVYNGALHGNKEDKNKNVWFLWHLCNRGAEFYIADQGEKEFDVEKKIEEQIKVCTAIDDTDGTGLGRLALHSDEYHYYSIKKDGTKKGTLLKIVKKSRTENLPIMISKEQGVTINDDCSVHPYKAEDESRFCDYIGHRLFRQKIGSGRPSEPEFVNSQIAHRYEKPTPNGNIKIEVYDAHLILDKNNANSEPYLKIRAYSNGFNEILKELILGNFKRSVYGTSVSVQPCSVISVEGAKKGLYVTKNMLQVNETPKIVSQFIKG